MYKLREYTNVETSLDKYKHTVLPSFDYATFFLSYSNLEIQQELQTMHNDKVMIQKYL